MALVEDQDGLGFLFLYFLESFSVCCNFQPLLQEGLFTILVGIISFFFMPSTPRDSRFLNERQKESASNSYILPTRIDLTLFSGLL